MRQNIAVIGAGSWGSALAHSLGFEHSVTLWNALPETLEAIQRDGENKKYLPGVSLKGVSVEADMAKAVEGKALVLLVVPSKFFRDTLARLAPFVNQNQIIISATKGLELNPIRTMTGLIKEALPLNPAVALSGPSHAEDVGAHKFSCLVAASTDEQAALAVQRAVSCPWIRVYSGSDPAGVEAGAAVKNIIAIAAGMVVEGGYGDNALAALVTRGIVEMTRFGLSIGGQPRTFGGLTGAGDLIVTCYSDHSRNRHVGRQLARGKKIEEIEASMIQVPEGVRAARQVYHYARKSGISMPIVESVYRVLDEGLALSEWENIIKGRPYTTEHNL